MEVVKRFETEVHWLIIDLTVRRILTSNASHLPEDMASSDEQRDSAGNACVEICAPVTPTGASDVRNDEQGSADNIA